MTNVLIVEDQSMSRQLFEMFVHMSQHYNLVKAIMDADMADYYCEKNQVDLILMDICTDMDSSGLDASARIKERFPHIKIIIVTSMPEYSYLKRAREIGVDSFWYKEVSQEPILELMDRTMSGERIFPDTTPEIRLGYASSYDMTERELDVLREMTSGETNAEIAEQLNLSPGTIKTHIQNMLQKTGFKTRTELAVHARQTGLVIKERKKHKD